MVLTISTTKLLLAGISTGDYNFHRWTSKPAENYLRIVNEHASHQNYTQSCQKELAEFNSVFKIVDNHVVLKENEK